MTSPRPAVCAGPHNLLTDVEGITVGNAQSARARSGATVVLTAHRMVAACDIRGGAPCTRETDALDPDRLVEEIDAIALSGGSTHGLDTASGVVAWLAARGRGFRLVPDAPPSPVVPSAALYDLSNGGDKHWGRWSPYREMGWSACENASSSFGLGTVGAGTGALVGTLNGGLGSASAVYDNGHCVGALVAVNAFGSAFDPSTGSLWAEPWLLDGDLTVAPQRTTAPQRSAQLDPFAATRSEVAPLRLGGHTSLAVVAVDLDLSPAEARRIAIMAQDGLARALRPIHTHVDGDVVFVIATGAAPPRHTPRLDALMRCGSIAADCVTRAVARGVQRASLRTAGVP